MTHHNISLHASWHFYASKHGLVVAPAFAQFCCWEYEPLIKNYLTIHKVQFLGVAGRVDTPLFRVFLYRLRIYFHLY